MKKNNTQKTIVFYVFNLYIVLLAINLSVLQMLILLFVTRCLMWRWVCAWCRSLTHEKLTQFTTLWLLLKLNSPQKKHCFCCCCSLRHFQQCLGVLIAERARALTKRYIKWLVCRCFKCVCACICEEFILFGRGELMWFELNFARRVANMESGVKVLQRGCDCKCFFFECLCDLLQCLLR